MGVGVRVKLLPLTVPVFLVAAYVIGAYAGSAGHWTTVLRPLGVSVLLAAIVTLACLAMTRRVDIATAVATAAMVIVTGQADALAALGLLMAALVLWALWRRTDGRRLGSMPATAAAGVAALVLLLTGSSCWTGAD